MPVVESVEITQADEASVRWPSQPPRSAPSSPPMQPTLGADSAIVGAASLIGTGTSIGAAPLIDGGPLIGGEISVPDRTGTSPLELVELANGPSA